MPTIKQQKIYDDWHEAEQRVAGLKARRESEERMRFAVDMVQGVIVVGLAVALIAVWMQPGMVEFVVRWFELLGG